jgi:Phosphoribosylpyrophosphate synthetase
MPTICTRPRMSGSQPLGCHGPPSLADPLSVCSFDFPDDLEENPPGRGHRHLRRRPWALKRASAKRITVVAPFYPTPATREQLQSAIDWWISRTYHRKRHQATLGAYKNIVTDIPTEAIESAHAQSERKSPFGFFSVMTALVTVAVVVGHLLILL